MTNRNFLGVVAIALMCSAGPLAWSPAEAASSADKVPEFDMRPGCQGASQDDLDLEDKPTEQSCLAEEEEARKQIEGIWTTFPESSRRECTAAQTDGPASYIDLLWCLKDAQTAEQLEKEDPSLKATAK